jgi:hypothetical protein
MLTRLPGILSADKALSHSRWLADLSVPHKVIKRHWLHISQQPAPVGQGPLFPPSLLNSVYLAWRNQRGPHSEKGCILSIIAVPHLFTLGFRPMGPHRAWSQTTHGVGSRVRQQHLESGSPSWWLSLPKDAFRCSEQRQAASSLACLLV